MANFFLAFELDLSIVPVLNKCDMDSAEPDVSCAGPLFAASGATAAQAAGARAGRWCAGVGMDERRARGELLAAWPPAQLVPPSFPTILPGLLPFSSTCREWRSS